MAALKSLLTKCKKLIKCDGDCNIIKIYSGYWGDSYRLDCKSDCNNKVFFVKHVVKNTSTGDYSEPEFNDLIKVYLLLQKVQGVKVKIPTVRAFSSPDGLLIQDFIEGNNFYAHLQRFCGRFKNSSRKEFADLQKVFSDFGSYLGSFHNSTLGSFEKNSSSSIPSEINDSASCLLHGDINSKNILFDSKHIHLFDPDPKVGPVYYDLAKTLLLFHPINPFLRLHLSSTCLVRLQQSFLKGYTNSVEVQISDAKLNKEFLSELWLQIKKTHSKSLVYLLKKQLSNLLMLTLIVKFKISPIRLPKK